MRKKALLAITLFVAFAQGCGGDTPAAGTTTQTHSTPTGPWTAFPLKFDFQGAIGVVQAASSLTAGNAKAAKVRASTAPRDTTTISNPCNSPWGCSPSEKYPSDSLGKVLSNGSVSSAALEGSVVLDGNGIYVQNGTTYLSLGYDDRSWEGCIFAAVDNATGEVTCLDYTTVNTFANMRLGGLKLDSDNALYYEVGYSLTSDSTKTDTEKLIKYANGVRTVLYETTETHDLDGNNRFGPDFRGFTLLPDKTFVVSGCTWSGQNSGEACPNSWTIRLLEDGTPGATIINHRADRSTYLDGTVYFSISPITSYSGGGPVYHSNFKGIYAWALNDDPITSSLSPYIGKAGIDADLPAQPDFTPTHDTTGTDLGSGGSAGDQTQGFVQTSDSKLWAVTFAGSSTGLFQYVPFSGAKAALSVASLQKIRAAGTSVLVYGTDNFQANRKIVAWNGTSETVLLDGFAGNKQCSTTPSGTNCYYQAPNFSFRPSGNKVLFTGTCAKADGCDDGAGGTVALDSQVVGSVNLDGSELSVTAGSINITDIQAF